MSKDMCDIYCYDEGKVNRIKAKIEEEDMGSIARLFKVLADENRSKIVFALCQDQELCVCDIANSIGATIANTSFHLRTLHKQGIVRFRKEGKLAFYTLDDQEHIKQLMMIASAHNKEVDQRV